KYKHQKFQEDAARAVVDVFKGQPKLNFSYRLNPGNQKGEQQLPDILTGFSNHDITPVLSNDVILNNLQKVQKDNGLVPSTKLEGENCFNLTVEMETGVGKTYTYIKTMYELNVHYGWCKFIVVVPSVAIREGVYKSFESTQEHFAEVYGKKIRFFIYNSSQLHEIENFASDSNINVMIINHQAFNTRGEDARRIYSELDSFQSRRPIDVLKKTNPIMIIDEPQSVEGKVTKEMITKFCPLMILRYSATHRKDSIYNMVYRLDAMDAYNQKLVKRIAVKGISESGSAVNDGYVYLENIILSTNADPMARLSFDCKGSSGVRQVTRKVGKGFKLFEKSGGLEQYKNDFVVSDINGAQNYLEFSNGVRLFPGDVVGSVKEQALRRIQIRETILSHIERERELFNRGIKVLSLFFIDEVSKYKQY
ncbi:MAG: DEAD/DEAH box helicase family protein, partial [Enterococcus sp.]|nr:DEAD/DEAH box helicase family protein [Enterococcus sp.]